MEIFVEFLPLWMFVALAVLLFTGYPVAFILGGVGLAFALIGDLFGVFRLQQLSLIPLRIYGGTMESPVLVAIPMFIFMRSMLEKSGVARDLLHALQVLLRRVPGGLALSVTLMGTIMAATTGIIGASVVMMTLLALPVMLERRYNMPLATGTIAASAGAPTGKVPLPPPRPGNAPVATPVAESGGGGLRLNIGKKNRPDPPATAEAPAGNSQKATLVEITN